MKKRTLKEREEWAKREIEKTVRFSEKIQKVLLQKKNYLVKIQEQIVAKERKAEIERLIKEQLEEEKHRHKQKVLAIKEGEFLF